MSIRSCQCAIVVLSAQKLVLTKNRYSEDVSQLLRPSSSDPPEIYYLSLFDSIYV